MEKTQVEVCKTDVYRYHEKLSNAFPFQIKEQKCHFEPEKTRELKTKTQLVMKIHPKKAKKYTYAEVCKDQSREIRNQGAKKTIQLSGETQETLIRTYEPEEICEDANEQHCHKIGTVVLEEVCDLKSSRIPNLGRYSKGKEEGEEGDNMRCLHNCTPGDAATLDVRCRIERFNLADGKAR